MRIATIILEKQGVTMSQLVEDVDNQDKVAKPITEEDLKLVLTHVSTVFRDRREKKKG